MDEEGAVHHSDVPPPLPYSLRDRKKSIAFFWTIFVIDTLAQPLILYYTLWYLTPLSHNLVFSISTACLGGVSVFEYFYRFYNLFRKGSKARPLNARRSWLDFFHINFTIVWLILAVELIVGTSATEPYIRLLAMPLPTVMYYFGAVHLSLDILRMRGYKAPFRISSTPRGSPMPTALYVLIEDIVAVDGGGGQKYRYALRTRYLSSPYFRHMLFEMNCFWAGGSLIFAGAITAIVFTTPRNVAYTLGWALPFAWAGVWTAITIPWVQSDLRREKAAWAEHRGLGGIPYTDDINAPTPPTRFESVQDRLSFLPFHREKQSAPTSSDDREDGPSRDDMDGQVDDKDTEQSHELQTQHTHRDQQPHQEQQAQS
ncbi:hypothetical protein DTO166G4_5795 [Paecilomyces variotii]|nr:hypothetical protein DTO032I3_4336 [Paecilomyces variotii]KAJ9212576.1 hypothetical protein DTO166G4_5795 [Paecilomyces variotii]KAJ9221247.1 hypothetical protein DTO169C6_6383 [Paecilomyces variotii]KAJ9230122.1 hypothetical protein DTO166G5_7500 [Paecilomyces variotii]KAJ9231681.1 hypothetical protein DTO169E5_7840 [Paecilomyces variotii]